MNATLDGLEHAVKSVVSKQDKINISIYADDFIITGASQTVLEQKVKPAVENFLKVRGLELSAEKTRITTLQEGFLIFSDSMCANTETNSLLSQPGKAYNDSWRIFENSSVRTVLLDGELIAEFNPRITGVGELYPAGVAKSNL